MAIFLKSILPENMHLLHTDLQILPLLVLYVGLNLHSYTLNLTAAMETAPVLFWNRIFMFLLVLVFSEFLVSMLLSVCQA